MTDNTDDFRPPEWLVQLMLDHFDDRPAMWKAIGENIARTTDDEITAALAEVNRRRRPN